MADAALALLSRHERGFIAQSCPAVWQKLLAELRSHDTGRRPNGVELDTDRPPLNVRCCEHHTYRVGAGLTEYADAARTSA